MAANCPKTLDMSPTGPIGYEPILVGITYHRNDRWDCEVQGWELPVDDGGGVGRG